MNAEAALREDTRCPDPAPTAAEARKLATPEDTAGQPAARLGATALVRAAGLPVSAWCSGGNPDLFDAAASLAKLRTALGARAAELGELLGEQAVPDDRLGTEERRAVLALRRRLHAGSPPGDLRTARLLQRTHPELACSLDALEREHARLVRAAAEWESRVAAERERVGLLGLELVRTYPALRELVDGASPYVVPELERRSAAGEDWRGKRLRKASGYVWRAVARAAAKTTPRGWAGQLAAAPVAEEAEAVAAPSLLPQGVRLGAVAAEAVHNLHLAATDASATDLRHAPGSTLLAMTALHTAPPAEGGEAPLLHCGVVDAEDRTRLRHVAVRRTGAVEMVRAVLAEGPKQLGELVGALTGGAEGERTAVARGLLDHLRRLGVLQVCAPPAARRLPWTQAAEARTWSRTPQLAEGAPGAWFLDSHRRLDGSLPAAAADRVWRGLRTASRLAALRDADGSARRVLLPPEAAELGTTPRRLGDIVTERLLAEADKQHRPEPQRLPRYRGWRPPEESGSGYAALLTHLASRLDEPHVDLGSRLLDALGAPDAEHTLPAWPLDCLLRPLPAPGPVAALETASPAGMLDARFAGALRTFHGGYSNADAYREFLAAVERETGARFVELLVPPLAEHAANAVRRPAAAACCTGDPNSAPHYGCTADSPHPPPLPRLSLDDITLRRSGDRLVAESRGRRLLPMHHATRTPLPPWDTVLRLLTSAGHPEGARIVQLDGLLGAFPEARRVPRLTVEGELVVSPAQWRLPGKLPWRPSDGDAAKVTALAELRAGAGLPRFGYVRTSPGGKPLPVDLAALPSLHLLERVCGQEGPEELLFEEALPAPGAHLLRDALHDGAAVAAGVLLRLPHRTPPAELAARAAARLPAADGTHRQVG